MNYATLQMLKRTPIFHSGTMNLHKGKKVRKMEKCEECNSSDELASKGLTDAYLLIQQTH